MNVGIISADIQFNEQSIDDSIRKLEQRARQIKLDICPEFCKDAFQYRIDDRPLQVFEQSIKKLTREIQAQTLAVNLKVNTSNQDKELLTLLAQSQGNRTITIREKEASNNRTGYQAQTREIVMGLQRVERAVSKVNQKSVLGNVITGFSEQTGANLNRQVVQGIRDVFGKDAATGARKITRSIGKSAKANFIDNEEFATATSEAQKILGDRLRKGLYRFGDGVVAALENREGDFKSKLNAGIKASTDGVEFKDVGAGISSEFKQAFDKVKAGLFSQNSLKNVAQPIGEGIAAYREQALKERAIPLVRERANEILQSGKTKNTANVVSADTNELIIASGGYAGARGLSGARLAKELNAQKVEGREALWIKNSDSDLPKESMSKAADKLQALLVSIGKPNLRGYSKDAVEMASQGLAAYERNPQITIKLMGESGGGFVAEEASKILDMLGVKNEFLGVGTPNFIGRLDNKDRKIISPDEVLGAETNKVYGRLGLANITPSQQILGVTGHPYENYRDKGVAELQNFLQGSPGKATPELMGDFKQGLQYFQKQDKTKLDTRQTEQLANAAYQNLQHIRRFMLVETGDTKKELEQIVKGFEAVFVDLSPDDRDFTEAKQSLAKAQEYLGYLQKQPGIQAAIVAQGVVKDLKLLKTQVGETLSKSTGTTEQKYKALFAQIEQTESQLNDTSLWLKPVPNKFKDSFQRYKEMTSQQQALKPVGAVDFSIFERKQNQKSVDQSTPVAPITPKLNTEEFEKSFARFKQITKSFSDAYKATVADIKKGDTATATGRAEILLQNTSRAKADIEAFRQSNNIPRIGEGQPTVVNNALGQIASTEKRLKQQFAKARIPLPEINPTATQQIGQNVVEGIGQGISQALPELKATSNQLSEAIVETVKDDLQIQSPSKVAEQLGRFFTEGFQNGLNSAKVNFDKFLSIGKLATVVGIGVNLFQKYGTEAANVAREFEQIEVKMSFASGGGIEATAKNMAFVESESDRLGTSFRDTASAYADLAASTKNTPLKGFSTEQIFKGVQEAGTVRQLSREDMGGVNTAIKQIQDKGTVQREELVGQLGERLSGSLDLAARSRGQTVQEFNRDTQRGLVTSDEFLPKFAQTLSAEASLSLPQAVNSSQAIINRYENSILSLQATMGKPIVAVQNTGLQALTFVIDNLNKSLPVLSSMFGVVMLRSIAKLSPQLLLTINQLKIAGSGSIIKGIGGIASAFGKLSLQTAGLLVLVEAIQALNKAFSSGSGELANYSKSVSDGLKRYNDIKAESLTGQQQSRFQKDKDLNLLQDNQTGELALPESAIGQGLLGFLPDRIKSTDDGLKKFGFSVRGAVQEIERYFGNYAEKTKTDRVADVTDLIESSRTANEEIAKLISNGGLNEQNQIDKQLRELANKRRAIAITRPDDSDSIADIRKQEEILLKRSQDLNKPTSVLSQQNTNTIEALKKSIEELDRVATIPSQYQSEYRQQASKLREQLELAEKAQTNLNKAIKAGLDNFTLFGQRVETIIAKFRDFQDSSQYLSLSASTQVNQLPDTFTPEQKSSLKQQIEIQLKSQEYQQLAQSLQQLQQLLSEQVGVLQPYGVDQSTGVNDAQRILEQVGNDPSAGNAKLVLEKFIEYKQLQQQLPQFANEVTQAQTDFAQSIRDNAKAVNEFYKELTNNASTLSLETKQTQNSNILTNAKTRLKQALVGNRDSFVTSYVDGLVGLIEALNKPLENAIESQKQLLAAQQNRIQQQTQLQQFENQSPLIANNLNASVDQSTNFSSGNRVVGAIASPSTTQNLGQVLGGSVSQGQSFFGKRKRGNHASVDFDGSEGLGGHSPFNAIFPGQVRTTTAWGKGYTDREGGENSNAIRIATPLSNGMEFLTDYGHYETPSARVRPGESVAAGKTLGRLSGNDTGSQGGHLDVKIRIPSQIASNFRTTQPDNRKQGYHFVDVKEFMQWYQNNQVGKNASSGGGSQIPQSSQSQNRRLVYGSSMEDSRGSGRGGNGLSSQLLNFVKKKEDFKPKAYWDYGQYSVGYGTKAKSPNETISETAGSQRLESELKQAQQQVFKELGATAKKLNSNQLDALTSLTYNAGSLKQFPKMLANLRSGNMQGAAQEFLDIDKAGSSRLGGLTTRRREEAQMFLGKNVDQSTPNNQNYNIPQRQSVDQSTPYTLPNQKNVLASNRQILANTAQQEKNIRSTLAANNKLATLEAELSRTKLRNQFDDGIKDAETQANQASRRIQDTKQGIGYDTPQKQRDIQIRDINREYVDSTRDLSKQLTELQSAKNTLSATRKIIQSGGFPQLKSELPQITDGIKRLDTSIDIVSSALEQTSKVRGDRLKDIDRKFAVEQNKRNQQFESSSARNEATRLRQFSDIAEQNQNGNPGDLRMGDPIRMRQMADNLEIMASLNDQIAQLEDMERSGERTTEQIAKLRLQYEGLAKSQLDATDLKAQRDMGERILRIEIRNLQIERKSLDYENQKTDLLAQQNELKLRDTPGNLSVESPNKMRLRSQISSGDLELREKVLQERQSGWELGLDEKTIQQNIDKIKELDSLKLDNLRRELKLTLVEQLRSVRDTRLETARRLGDSENALLGAKGEYFTSRGLSDRNEQKQIAVNNQNQAFADGMKAIDDYAKSVNLSSESVAKLRDNLRELNDLKLGNIQAQFDPFQQVANSAVSGLQSSIEGLLSETMDFGDAFQNIGQSISSTLAKLASEWITNELVKGIFGMGKAKTPSFGQESKGGGLLNSVLGGVLGGEQQSGIGGLMGNVFGSLGSIFGFKDGGEIEASNHKALRDLPIIGDALKREGNNATLIAATPGEEVLSLKSAKIYRKLFPKGIENFKSGGTIGGGMQTPTFANMKPFARPSNNNVSVNINGSGGNGDINVESLQRVIINELERQQQPGGVSYRPGY